MMRNEIKWEKLSKCCLCKSRKIEIFLDDVRYWEFQVSFNLYKCSKCDYIFLNPRPKQEYIGNFYKSESYWGQDLNNIKELKQEREKSFSKIYSLINIDHKKSIFDIGAGTGLFLSKFKDIGWKADGIEYSNDAVKFANKAFGVSLLRGDLLNKSIKLKYDYIVLNNVLEHLFDPLKTIKKVESMLNEGGKVIIAVPNIDSLGFKIFKKDWYPLQPPIHLSQFTPDTIKLILKKSGLEIIHIDHNNPIHSKFSIFESYRSKLTGRNKVFNNEPRVIGEVIGENNNIIVVLVKKLGVLFGIILSYVLSYLGFFLRKGENIIIYAEKK